MRPDPVVVIGGGVGGLTAAALLVQAGLSVTVLEAHVYPGGSAGTFYHQGYRFDAGATLAGGFAPGGPHARLAEQLGLTWPVSPLELAWVVHLPGLQVAQWCDPQRWQQERQRAFPGSEPFWHTQERLAAEAWRMAQDDLPWPPQSLAELGTLAGGLRGTTLAAAPYAVRKMVGLLPNEAKTGLLHTFVDAQLLISAQAPAAQANALYGCAALDLPRRGVNQVHGGMGALAKTLANWITIHGGQVLYRQAVDHIALHNGRVRAVHTHRGLELAAGRVVANLTPMALAALLGEAAPDALSGPDSPRPAGWGAFTLYLGLQGGLLPAGHTDHHQVVVDPALPLGEGNSIFMSLSPADEAGRAPQGMRPATISTHTAVEPWWQLAEHDPAAYARRKQDYTERVLSAAETALPGLRAAVRLCLPGTPLSFQRFTRRPLGLVGGSPQTSLFTLRGPATGIPNLWLVGDSIFPGQSTAGVTLGAMRAAQAILAAG